MILHQYIKTGSDDVEAVKKKLEAFLEKHFLELNRSNASGCISEALEELEKDIQSLQEQEDEDNAPGFSPQREWGTWNHVSQGIKGGRT